MPAAYLAGYAETLLFLLCALPVVASCRKDRAGLTVTVTDVGGGGLGVPLPAAARPTRSMKEFWVDGFPESLFDLYNGSMHLILLFGICWGLFICHEQEVLSQIIYAFEILPHMWSHLVGLFSHEVRLRILVL